MITPYPPPRGPRIELLRVRRADPPSPDERLGQGTVHGTGGDPPCPPATDGCDEPSDDGLALLAHDPATPTGRAPNQTDQHARSRP
jgi:hypothetical protein